MEKTLLSGSNVLVLVQFNSLYRETSHEIFLKKLFFNCVARLCLANEEYKINGSPCQLTCDSYPQADEIEAKCPKDIPISGCFCKHGYVRSATGGCILPNRCPRPLVS